MKSVTHPPIYISLRSSHSTVPRQAEHKNTCEINIYELCTHQPARWADCLIVAPSKAPASNVVLQCNMPHTCHHCQIIASHTMTTMYVLHTHRSLNTAWCSMDVLMYLYSSAIIHRIDYDYYDATTWQRKCATDHRHCGR
jgi:hypothetical protein